MKHFTFLTLLLFIFISAFSQVPDAFNYQAVVRDESGNVIAEKDVAFRISILKDSETGTPVYVEKHITPTNRFGLATLKIGKGTQLQGIFGPGGWGISPHFIKVEIDPEGGNSYLHMGTTQLLSVPYAFHAQTVANDSVVDNDADPLNEIQTIRLDGTELSLSEGGGKVTLPEAKESPWQDNGNVVSLKDDDRSYTFLNVYSNFANRTTFRSDSAYTESKISGQEGAYLRLYSYSGENGSRLQIKRYASNMPAILEYYSESELKYSVGLLKNNENFAIGSNTTFPELEIIKESGNVRIRNELQTVRTKDANMMPIAYGTVKADGTVEANSGNIQVSKTDNGTYEINIEDETYKFVDYITSATPYSLGFIRATSSSGKLIIRTYSPAGNLDDMYFSFVVYKP